MALSWLLAAPEAKVAPIVAVQRWHSAPLHWIARGASSLCDEEFYVLAAVLFAWTVPSVGLQICTHMLVLMAVGYILGNILKNLFCFARPLSPPVIRVRKLDELDYAFPSTHSMQAVSQPLFFTYLIFYVWNVESEWYLWTWLAGNGLITLTIIASRIYLGAHHVQDVTVGAVLGVGVGLMYCYLGTLLDTYLAVGSWQVPLCTTALLAGLVMIHPNEIYLKTRLSRFNQTVSQNGYLVSATVAGCASGAILGAWAVAQHPHVFYAVSLSQHPKLVLLRFIVGPVICATLYVACKKLLRAVLLSLWRIFEIPLFDPPAKAPTDQETKQLYMEKTGGTIYLNYATQPMRKKAPYQRHTKNAASWSLQLSRDSMIHRLGLNSSFAVLFGSGMQVMPIVKFVQYLLLTFVGFFPVPALFSLLGI